MKVSDFKLGEVVLIQIQPKSSTIGGGIRVVSMSGKGIIIGIDSSLTERRPFLVGWKVGETFHMHRGAPGHPTFSSSYILDVSKLNADYPNQLWIELADVSGKVSATQVSMGSGATCKCGWQNPYYNQPGVIYVCQSCIMWQQVAG